MRINIKPFTKEEVNTINTFMQKEVLTDNNDEIITTFLDVKNGLGAAADEDADVTNILHLAFDNEKSIKRIKVFGDSVFLVKILMLLTAFRGSVLPEGAKPGMKFLSENFFTVEFDSIDSLQNILLDDVSVNYGLDLEYLNDLGVAKLIIDGIRETEEFVDGLIALQCASDFKLFDELTEQILDNDELRLSFAKTVTTAILDKKLGFVSGRHKNGTVDWGIAVVPDGGIDSCDPNDLLAIPIIDNSPYKTQHELHQQYGPEKICNAVFESVVTNLFDTDNRKGVLAFLDALGMKFNVIPKKVSEFETADDEDADESSMFSEI
jgi:hypothetical protein